MEPDGAPLDDVGRCAALLEVLLDDSQCSVCIQGTMFSSGTVFYPGRVRGKVAMTTMSLRVAV